MLALAPALMAIAIGATRGVKPAECRHLPSPPNNRAISNDNRVRAGNLREGVLTVRLVIREAAWRPDGAAGCALTVRAFSEEGRATQIPGPLLRVRAGTEIRATVRNALRQTLWVRGLQDRVLENIDSIELPAGATREIRFVAKTPGAWFYWGGGVNSVVPSSDVDGQLVGALVVDPANDTTRATTQDRVLVMTRWSARGSAGNDGFQINAFNGRSWPNTERVTYSVGDSVFWKVINATSTTHEMHLHGFYFRIDGGGFLVDSAKPRGGVGVKRVTAVMRPAEWYKIAWVPDRAGNWLYHCHLLTHMNGAQRLSRIADSGSATGHHHVDGAASTHAMDDMAGLILGIVVRGRPGRIANRSLAATPAPRRRQLDLFANEQRRRFGERTGYGFVLQEGPLVPATDSIRIPGTPLILTRNEPVQITVHNRLRSPINLHWHGIELDSYFDGVGGFSGTSNRVAPMIAAGGTFQVRFTPPRAGTFIYHVHGETGEELTSGLYGPLVVVDSGTTYDERSDRVFVLSDGGPGATPPVFINGTIAGDTAEMRVGVTYRLRFIFITANDVVQIALNGPSGLAPATLVAFDGRALDGAPPTRPLQTLAGPGHTQDFLFTPTAPGDYSVSAQRLKQPIVPQIPIGPVTTVQIRVRSP